MRNVEIKARVHDRTKIVNLAQKLVGEEPAELLQHDIFYNSPNGRLKMRSFTVNGVKKSELIWYNRPDQSGPKLSEYNKTELDEATLESLKISLALSMGIKGEVKKSRTLFIYEQTRIHIDTVEGLGDFMELEVVLNENQTVEDGDKTAKHIQKLLEVSDEDLLTVAYMDMLNARK
ncbi:unnamed protein product [Auanema sp. JU1783]|nr:unnamed protein product [Auanema sp. JU1783]